MALITNSDSLNILVVEDNEHDYKKISRAFSLCRFNVTLTRSIRAKDALTLINNTNTSFDVLVTSYMIPGLNGFELCEQLIGTSQPFPIILLIGEGDEHIAAKAIKLGVFDYLSKDIDSVFMELLPETALKAKNRQTLNLALKESQALNHQLSLTLEQSRSAISIANLQQEVIYLNPQFERLNGVSRERAINQSIFLALEKTVSEQELRGLWTEVIQKQYSQRKIKLQNNMDDAVWMSISMTAVRANNEVSSILIVQEIGAEQDHYYRLEAEQQLKQSAEKQKEVAQKLALTAEELEFQRKALDIHAIVSLTDEHGNITYANENFIKISQYSYDELIGQNHRLLKSGFHPDSFYKEMWQTITVGKVWTGEIQDKAKDGSLYWVSASIIPMLDQHFKPKQYISIRTDITESKKQQHTLEMMAHYDVLTKLPNRLLLSDRFSQSIAHSKRTDTALAVCFLDLDNFKPINDMYGHKVGDELLVQVADRIKACIRQDDTVSRHGGDEFIILLGSLETLFECEEVIERIIKTLAEPYILGKHRAFISASLGFTLYPNDNSDLDTLVRHADHAMYQAKLSGRNTYSLFNTLEDQKSIKQHTELHAIKSALENEHFSLFYQPKVNMKQGTVFGVEALIRWQKTDGTMVMPLSFLSVIKNTSLEIGIGDWVINTALSQMSQWLEQGLELQVSINISSFHLLSAGFKGSLKNAIAKYPAINPNLIQIEILESSELGDEKIINDILKSIQTELGVTIALDDFGTGYSSLTHLKGLTVNTIKIDQSFVRDILDDPNDYAIVDGVIGLSEAFHRDVIAEGVETTDHGLILLNMGCEKAQGYGIARPMPSEKVYDWINAYLPEQQWLDFGAKTYNLKESRKELLLLVLSRWVYIMKSNIDSPPDRLMQWPILNSDETSCGVWIARELSAQLFEEQWLRQIKALNETITDYARTAVDRFQSGNFALAKVELDKLLATFQQIKLMI